MAEEQATKPKNDGSGLRVCPRCDFDNRSDALFCGNCGAHLVGKPCLACKALNPDGAQYCDRCGTWLDKPAQQRSFLTLYPINALSVLLAAAVVVLISAALQFLLAFVFPGPATLAQIIIGLGLGATGLILTAGYWNRIRPAYSR